MFELLIGYILFQILMPDKSIEFQVGPLENHEQDYLKILSLEDTENWILKQVEMNYTFHNPKCA